MSDAPGGLSDAEFKSWYVEAGDWLLGTVQGGFNEKMSVSQIVVDAIIGMIPLVGDVTAVRDLIAISMGMSDSEEKRKSVLEWITLVILLLALIPVLGGVIKGVGKLTVRAARQAAKAGPEAVLRILGQTAEEIIEFMNRLGVGNAKKWFLDLNITQYQGAIIKNFNDLTNGIITAIDKTLRRASWVLPNNLIERMKQISASMKTLQQTGKEMIPQAVKEFNDQLIWMQQYIRTGGTPQLAMATGTTHAAASTSHAAANTSQSTAHAAGGVTPPKAPEKVEIPAVKGNKPPKLANVEGSAVAGKQNKSRTRESRIDENRKADPPPPKVKGYPKNDAVKGSNDWKKHYTPDPANGYPDLTKKVEKNINDGIDHYTEIEAFCGKMVNRELKSNEKIYRVFGEKGTTYGVAIDEAKAGGKWWGVGNPPKDAREWREMCAVRDEWNRDQFIVVGTPPKCPQKPVKGVFGTVSEQYSTKINGQYLPGGYPQGVLDIPQSTTDMLTDLGRKTIQDGQVRKFTCPTTGVEFDIRPTGWPDANGVHGYAAHGNVTFSVGTVPVTTAANKTTPQIHQETHIK